MSHDNPAKSSEPRWGDREDRIRELEHPYAELKSRLTRHAQSGWSIATDAVVAIDELERKLKKMTEDRDMWFDDDIKQNNAVGRLVAEKERRMKEEVGVPISLYRAVISRMIKQRSSSTDLGLIRQLEALDPDFKEAVHE